MQGNSSSNGMQNNRNVPVSGKGHPDDLEVSEFLAKVKELAVAPGDERGRLIFAMDATMSRQPTWDMAMNLQGDMFKAIKTTGGLDVQLVYFRGLDECRASKWVSDPEALAKLMTSVKCHGGYTQIRMVLNHAIKAAGARRVNAIVYVGDSMEEEIDELCAKAGELGLLGVPMFLFQEGHDARAARAFREIARLTNGATLRFDSGAAGELRQLLAAVAAYAAGGHKALRQLGRTSRGDGARRLLAQMKPNG
jgi:hypothetical protein